MICPKCNNQFNIYNARENKNKKGWYCPDCIVRLNEDDLKEFYYRKRVDKQGQGQGFNLPPANKPQANSVLVFT